MKKHNPYDKPDESIQFAARQLAAVLARVGWSYTQIRNEIHKQLGWNLSGQAVHKWFDPDGTVRPLKKRISNEIAPPIPTIHKDAALLPQFLCIPETTDSLPESLQKQLAMHFSASEWLTRMAEAFEQPSESLVYLAQIEKHTRAIAALISAIPREPDPIDLSAPDPIEEYISAFKEVKTNE